MALKVVEREKVGEEKNGYGAHLKKGIRRHMNQRKERWKRPDFMSLS